MGDATSKESKESGTLDDLRGIWDRIVALKFPDPESSRVYASGETSYSGGDLPMWGLVSVGEFPHVVVCSKLDGSQVTAAFVYYWFTCPGPEWVQVTELVELVSPVPIAPVDTDVADSPALDCPEQ